MLGGVTAGFDQDQIGTKFGAGKHREVQPFQGCSDCRKAMTSLT
jgi:hypothetical protein